MRSLKTLKAQIAISAFVATVGIILMVAKIYWDSEPGAIPLALVLLGTGWFSFTRVRLRSHRNLSAQANGRSD